MRVAWIAIVVLALSPFALLAAGGLPPAQGWRVATGVLLAALAVAAVWRAPRRFWLGVALACAAPVGCLATVGALSAYYPCWRFSNAAWCGHFCDDDPCACPAHRGYGAGSGCPGMSLALPAAPDAPTPEGPTIAVSKDSVTLNGVPEMSARELQAENNADRKSTKLYDALVTLKNDDQRRHPGGTDESTGQVIIQADENVDFSVVERIMRVAQKAGYKRVVVVTSHEKPADGG